MSGVVDVAVHGAALDGDRFAGRVDDDALHGLEVEHEPFTGPEPGAVVRSAADGEVEALLTGEGDAGDDVGDVDALGDQRGSNVHPGVEDGAGALVVGAGGPYQAAAELRLESVDVLGVEGDVAGLSHVRSRAGSICAGALALVGRGQA